MKTEEKIYEEIGRLKRLNKDQNGKTDWAITAKIKALQWVVEEAEND